MTFYHSKLETNRFTPRRPVPGTRSLSKRNGLIACRAEFVCRPNRLVGPRFNANTIFVPSDAYGKIPLWAHRCEIAEVRDVNRLCRDDKKTE